MNIRKNNTNNLKFVCLKTPIEEFLTKDDVDYYKNLKYTVSSHICRNCRNRRIQSFSEILSAIHYFVTRKKEDSWKRSLICGVCWYKNYIVVNIRQMSYLLDKCKSSINGSLQQLCFIVLPDKQQSLKIIIEAIPYLKNHSELIQTWSVRQYVPLQRVVMPFMPINQFIIPQPVNYNYKFPKPNIHVKKSEKPVIKTVPDKNVDIKPENHEEIPIKTEQNKEDKIQNSSSSDIFSNLFEEAGLSEGFFDRYNLF